MAVSFKGAHFPQDIILMGVRWSVAYPLSTRHVEELMRERGVHVDHSTMQPVGGQIQPAAGGNFSPLQGICLAKTAREREMDGTATQIQDEETKEVGALTDGFHLVIDALKLNDIHTIYNVPGIPITDLGRYMQAAGMRVLSFRH